MFSFVENVDDFVHFPDVNSKTDFCKAIIDPDFKATLQNIFVSSAVMFGTYEELLTTFFREPACQKLTFNLPTSIQSGLHLYEKFPQILAKFINKLLKIKSVCTVFYNNKTAPAPNFEIVQSDFSVSPKCSSEQQGKKRILQTFL